jgi:hypothetical protein
MRSYKIALIIGLALAVVPAGAFAAKPSHPVTPASTNANTTQGKPATAKVQFVLHGSLSAYTAVNGTTNGTISILVKSSNRGPSTLKGTTLTFIVTPGTKIVLHQGKAIAPTGDTGIVKFRAAKNNATWTGLSGMQVIDQGAPAA